MRNSFFLVLIVLCLGAAFVGHSRPVGRNAAEVVDAAGLAVPQVKPAGQLAIQQQGVGHVLLEIFSNPAVITGVASLATWVYNRVAKANASRDRWRSILATGVAIADELVNRGARTAGELAARILSLLVREIEAAPGTDTLTEDEVERLKPWALQIAKRKLGIVEEPMR